MQWPPSPDGPERMIGRTISNTLRLFLHALAQRAARAYVVGPDLVDAMRVCGSLDANGFAATICAWHGEDDQAADNAARCLNEIEAIALEKYDCYVSFKAHDLWFSQDLIAQVANRARCLDVGIHFDHGYILLQRRADDVEAGAVGVRIPKWPAC